ncbi:MAG: aminodeoxychorismate/anthranilate synthase component II [Legionellales bacterium]|nr:MAG: aminodeoxychorismate/anthranilate synthase component II [Legionellales bacterium]
MILLIDNYDSFTYNLFQLISNTTTQVQVIRNDKISIEEIKLLNPSGIVLSPGPGRPETAGICIDLIKQLSGIIPILGVCLGHQAIAVAYNAKVINANDIVHGKSTQVLHDGTGIYKDVPSPFSAARYHSLIIEKETLPKELAIESTNDEGIIMGIRHKDFPVYGVQFHPESILSADGYKLMENFLSLCEKNKSAA